MKTCYDKWGKRGFSNNFIIKEFDSCTTNTLVDGSYIFKDIIFSEGEIHWDYPLDSLQIGCGMFQNCTSLTSFTVDLNSLTNGLYMFNSSGIVLFNQELNSLTNGKFMFYNCTALTDFSSNMNSLKGTSSSSAVSCMFRGCTNLKTFKGELKNLGYGSQMFYGCTALTDFSSDLSSLKNGYQMFRYCKSLKKFTTPLGKDSNGKCILTNGFQMFDGCENLTKFEGDLSSITNGTGMFYRTKINSDVINNTTTFNSLTNGSTMFYGCKSLTSIKKDFSNVTNGNGMFMQCGTSDDGTLLGLSDFEGNLKSVTDGGFMFQGCENLRTFHSNLESLVTATSMFNDCVLLSDFVLSGSDSQEISTDNLKNLLNGGSMFVGCFSLCEFEYDLSSLKNGYNMFNRCYGLTKQSENEKQEEGKPKPVFKTFTPNLSNLMNGQYMFCNCRLDTETIQSIANTIKDVNGLKDGTTITDESGKTVGIIRRIIDICIDKDDPNSDEIGYFKSMANKGWTVHVQKFILWDENDKPKQFYGKYLEVSEVNATHRLEIKNEKGEIISVKFVILIGGSHVYGKTEEGEICSDDSATKIGYQKYVDEADAIKKLNLIAIKK